MTSPDAAGDRGQEAPESLEARERRYAAVLAATRDGVYEWPIGGARVWISSRLAALLEFDDVSAGGWVSADRVRAAVDPRDVAAVDALLADPAALTAPFTLQLRRAARDGTRRWLRNRGSVARDAAGRPTAIIGAISDVTDDVRAQEALQRSEARTRQAQKMDALGTLASGIAHDFNNLLAVILGYVDVGMAAPAPAGAQRALREIATAARRARDLVRRILTFGRRDDGGRAPVPIAPVVADLLTLLRGSLVPGVAIETEVADDVGAVLADGSGLQLLLLNLALNAQDAMRQGGGTLTVGAASVHLPAATAIGAATLPPGPWVRLTVRDTGVGIAPELLDRVVEPFFTTKPVGEGTGLGLAMVHGLVRNWGGGLHITSVVGVGTRVDVWIPSAGDAPAPASDAAAPPPPPSERRRVLVVDDDAAVGAVTVERLALLGYDATAVGSAEAALAALAAAPGAVSVVVADVAMPGRPGDVLARDIRDRWPHLPVVLCTGHGMSAEAARAAGAVALLQKPVESADLAVALATATATATVAATGATAGDAP